MKQHHKGNGQNLDAPYVPVIEKIDVTEWLEIKQHSRMKYLALNPRHVRIYDLQQGDKLKIKIMLVRKAPRDLDGEEAREE